MRREFRHGNDERDLSRKVENAISSSVRLSLYPKTVINIHVLILQDAGGAAAAATTCASLALVDAGIECHDIVAACSVCQIGDFLALDASMLEQKSSDAEIMVAYMPALDRVNLVSQRGPMLGNQIIQATDSALQGCKLLGSIMRKCLTSSLARAEGVSD